MEYQVVFDASQQGFPWWLILTPALPFLIIVIAWQAFKRRGETTAPAKPLRVTGETPSTSTPMAIRASISSVGLIVGACFACVTFVVMLSAYSNYFNAQSMLREGRTLVVEGTVTGYARSTTGRDPGSAESFFVNGVRFSYSQSSTSVGFHTAAKYGGPVRDGLFVRIHYANLPGDPSEPTILELEVKK